VTRRRSTREERGTHVDDHPSNQSRAKLAEHFQIETAHSGVQFSVAMRREERGGGARRGDLPIKKS
jgi:hypothetical protein